jgi:hypothetical protein
MHFGGQVIGTSGEHPFFVEGKSWTKAFELQPGDRVATADGVGVLVEEVWDTGEWEPVYNLRVADHHTYFVGDETWGWAAWAHNAYKWTRQSANKYNYYQGNYMFVSSKENPVSYSKIWWRPRGTNVNTLETTPCVDHSTGLGDRLQAKAQSLADGWTAMSEAIRYGARLQSTIVPRLVEINGYLAADGKPTVTLEQIDRQGVRFPSLTTANTSFTPAVKDFWFHRSVAIGCYVHDETALAFALEAGLTYTVHPTPSPDFTYVKDGKTTYFEIMPETSLADHSRRGMNTFVYRAIFYNRNTINNPGAEEPN